MPAANSRDGTTKRKAVGHLRAEIDHAQMKADVETGAEARTFDFARHGRIQSHRYRSYFEAQPGSTTRCAYCGRVIRYCYAMHDRIEKTFVIGSCDFWRYRGTKQYACLKAAQVLQERSATTSGQELNAGGQQMEGEANRGWLISPQRRERNGTHKH